MECEGFFGCAWSFLLSEGFRNLVIVLGVVVAVVSVVSARAIARKKQSADLLFDSRNDKELVEGMRLVSQLHEDTSVNMRCFAAKDKGGTTEAKAIRYVLNHYEYISVGIQAGIYDEQMLKEGSYNTVVRLYQRAKPFIEAVREVNNRETIYQEFQWLAKRWEETPLPSKRKVKRRG